MSDREALLEEAVDAVLEASAILDVVYGHVERTTVATQSLVEYQGLTNAWIQIWLTKTEELAFRRAVRMILEASDRLGDAFKPA